MHALLSDEEELEILTIEMQRQVREEGAPMPTMSEAQAASRAARVSGSPRDGDAGAARASQSSPGPLPAGIQRALAKQGLPELTASQNASPAKAGTGL